MTDPAAEAFLRAFRAASADGRAMDVIASDADGFAAALEASPDAVRQALDEAGGDQPLARSGVDDVVQSGQNGGATGNGGGGSRLFVGHWGA